jgi:hypothetical protein
VSDIRLCNGFTVWAKARSAVTVAAVTATARTPSRAVIANIHRREDVPIQRRPSSRTTANAPLDGASALTRWSPRDSAFRIVWVVLSLSDRRSTQAQCGGRFTLRSPLAARATRAEATCESQGHDFLIGAMPVIDSAEVRLL